MQADNWKFIPTELACSPHMPHALAASRASDVCSYRLGCFLTNALAVTACDGGCSLSTISHLS
jgi:hypothetical protein